TKNSAPAYSHFELESLPSGGWGYLHFPVTARYARKLGLDSMGMTGKFHTSWGDFHSLKNRAALEFEAFRMLSMGFACSIGDQLEPGGRLNPATYRLIGDVYRPFAEREAWARPSTPLSEAALLTAEDPLHEHRMSNSIMGAVQVLEELALQFDILDLDMPLDGYRLVVVPEDVPGSPALSQKLDAFVASGGAVLAAGCGALSEHSYPACFGANHLGATESYPDFLIAEGALARDLEPGNEYAIYLQGQSIAPNGDGEAALYARAPFFRRSGDRFCSHRYTPSAKGQPYPAAVRAGGALLFGHPLFEQYRDCAPHWVKVLIKNALDALLPDRLVTHDGPSTATVQLLSQPEHDRVCAHVLTYVPVRKSATIDIVEERTKVMNLTLRLSLPAEYKVATLQPEGVELPFENGRVTIPEVDGYAIVAFTR
ncbi:MAG: beta-galactosidase, partial [Clostridiales bacterium]|nr:beta-galactosidase [Clostridiales bacterium]